MGVINFARESSCTIITPQDMLIFIFYYHTIDHNVYLQVEIVIGDLFFAMQILY